MANDNTISKLPQKFYKQLLDDINAKQEWSFTPTLYNLKFENSISDNMKYRMLALDTYKTFESEYFTKLKIGRRAIDNSVDEIIENIVSFNHDSKKCSGDHKKIALLYNKARFDNETLFTKSEYEGLKDEIEGFVKCLVF